VNELHKKGFLIDHLTMPRHVNPQSCQSYMGICKYKNDQAHRIDIKYYPIDQFAYAVLYFTGSDMFNRKMRLEAMNLGYHLSDHGMYKCVKEGTKVTQTGPNIHCKAEKEIFEILGLEYKEPKDRSL
jgi:DNA polymerase lambda